MGVTELIMMKSDVLDSFDTIKACVAYELPDGSETKDFPYEIDNVKPIYKEFPGWKKDMTKCKHKTNFHKLSEIMWHSLRTILRHVSALSPLVLIVNKQ